MWSALQSILELTRNAEGPLKTADEVEGQLIEELRRLGHDKHEPVGDASRGSA